ncbi:MAG TPA: type I restriction enzyme endonuclease domain-containing protein [Chitinophagales bacterium]|nr:type I restriction enzyme endonuclease domain-containing protein [Chitinophagales bacterium]
MTTLPYSKESVARTQPPLEIPAFDDQVKAAAVAVLVKRTLTKYGYPPDKQQKAIDTVLKQRS